MTPDMPPELAAMREFVSKNLSGNAFQQTPAYPGQVAAGTPGAMGAAGNMMQYLMTPNQGNNGQWSPGQGGQGSPYPMGNTGNAPPQGGPGGYGNIPNPQIWDQAGQTYSNMMQNGMPTNMSPLYEQMKQQTIYDTQRAAAQTRELSGLKGQRYSSGLMNSIGNASAQGMANLGTAFTGQQLQALESARGRQLQAAQGGQQLGGQINQSYLDRINAATGLGQAQYGMQSDQLAKQYAAWQQQQSYNNPYNQMAYGYAMGYPFGAQTPEVTQTPTFWGSLLGAGTALGAAKLMS
jgi:hypothetical protein